jgi:hypothetical protein
VRAAAALLESRRGVYFERVAAGPNRGMLDPPSALSERALRGRLTREGFQLESWSTLGTVRHGILDRSYIVSVYRARVEPAVKAHGEWLSRRRLGDAPLTARAKKALALAGT